MRTGLLLDGPQLDAHPNCVRYPSDVRRVVHDLKNELGAAIVLLACARTDATIKLADIELLLRRAVDLVDDAFCDGGHDRVTQPGSRD